MKAITLWEPFATAIPLGLKRIETRHWSTNYRGPLAIHAAKKRDKTLEQISVDGGISLEQLQYGNVVAVVNLAAVCPIEHLRRIVSKADLHFGDYQDGRFGWVLTDIKAIKPFPLKGGQGFFNIPDELFL